MFGPSTSTSEASNEMTEPVSAVRAERLKSSAGPVPGLRRFRRISAAEERKPPLVPFAKAQADRAEVARLRRARWGDRLGICLSGLCILHCALTPVALAALPSMNAVFLRDHFHGWFAFLIGGSALLAFVPGYRAHGDLRVFLWAAPGFAAIVAAAIWGGGLGVYGEAAASITGSALLLQAHRLNRALCACCRTHGRKSSGGIKQIS